MAAHGLTYGYPPTVIASWNITTHHPVPEPKILTMSVRMILLSSAVAITTACAGTRPTGSDASAIRGAIGGARAPSVATKTNASAAPSAASQDSGWISLFDGTTLAGWHNYGKPGQPATGWGVVDGNIVNVGKGGDLTTNSQYANFELELQWKAVPGGSSGIIYRIDPSAEVASTSGPEMQIGDDTSRTESASSLTAAGSTYGLYPAPPGLSRSVGEWNDVRLVVNGNHVEQWLNGTKAVEYELNSEDWNTRRNASEFAQYDRYGRAAKGNIALQNAGGSVYFRNIRLRALP